MSLATDSPGHSSSSDDFAAMLDGELDTASDESADLEDVSEEEEIDDGNKGDIADEGDLELDHERVKRRKVELSESITNLEASSTLGEPSKVSGSLSEEDTCPHPGVYAGMCMRCGQKMDDDTGVAFGYVHKNLRLANEEIARLWEKDLKNLLHRKKLYLVLDLDHTLLNSVRLVDITMEEGYLHDRDSLPDSLKSSLFRLDRMRMMTKLRPFVHTFLKEASSLFEMYIYTMGERPYALEMAKLLDPGDIYFNSRIIAQGDCTQRHQKGLDVVMGKESAVLILDDTEMVWVKHKQNLILMERYHFFASSCKHFGVNCKSLSELRSDESETEGALYTVLRVLQRAHNLYFSQERKDRLEDWDVRQVLQTVRMEILKDSKIVFSRVFPTNFPPEQHHLWKMAEQLGATCATETDESVTHIVSMDAGTDKSHWAVQEKKFLVHPSWIEACSYMWQKQPEEKFPIIPSPTISEVAVSSTNFLHQPPFVFPAVMVAGIERCWIYFVNVLESWYKRETGPAADASNSKKVHLLIGLLLMLWRLSAVPLDFCHCCSCIQNTFFLSCSGLMCWLLGVTGTCMVAFSARSLKHLSERQLCLIQLVFFLCVDCGLQYLA